jgi:hypothetical protein
MSALPRWSQPSTTAKAPISRPDPCQFSRLCFELGEAPLYLLDEHSQARLRSISIRRRERRRLGPVSARGLQRIPDLVKALREKIEGHLAV